MTHFWTHTHARVQMRRGHLLFALYHPFVGGCLRVHAKMNVHEAETWNEPNFAPAI